MSPKETLQEKCKETWYMLKLMEEWYDEDSEEISLWRARWCAYAQAYDIVYGEEINY